jgi:hypothetical protein
MYRRGASRQRAWLVWLAILLDSPPVEGPPKELRGATYPPRERPPCVRAARAENGRGKSRGARGPVCVAPPLRADEGPGRSQQPGPTARHRQAGAWDSRDSGATQRITSKSDKEAGAEAGTRPGTDGSGDRAAGPEQGPAAGEAANKRTTSRVSGSVGRRGGDGVCGVASIGFRERSSRRGDVCPAERQCASHCYTIRCVRASAGVTGLDPHFCRTGGQARDKRQDRTSWGSDPRLPPKLEWAGFQYRHRNRTIAFAWPGCRPISRRSHPLAAAAGHPPASLTPGVHSPPDRMTMPTPRRGNLPVNAAGRCCPQPRDLTASTCTQHHCRRAGWLGTSSRPERPRRVATVTGRRVRVRTWPARGGPGGELAFGESPPSMGRSERRTPVQEPPPITHRLQNRHPTPSHPNHPTVNEGRTTRTVAIGARRWVQNDAQE